MGDKTSIEWTDATWLGVSCEDQATADERIPRLLETPAAVRFVSLDPLLGPIDIAPFLSRAPKVKMCPRCLYFTNRDEQRCPNDGALLGPDIALDWVIVGGESGPHARPCDVAWIRLIVEQCKSAGVACFVKQLGTRPYGLGCPIDCPCGLHHGFADRKGGDWDEWPHDLRVREFPGNS